MLYVENCLSYLVDLLQTLKYSEHLQVLELLWEKKTMEFTR